MGPSIRRDLHWILAHPVVFFKQSRLGKVLVASLLALVLFLLYRLCGHALTGFSQVNRLTDLLKAPSKRLEGAQLAEHFPLFRDLYSQEVWPEISRERSVTPDQAPATVHYIWCGKNQQFRFHHYLGILSVIRLLQPLKVVFHYSDLPVPDRLWYHVWFWVGTQTILRQSGTEASGSRPPKLRCQTADRHGSGPAVPRWRTVHRAQRDSDEVSQRHNTAAVLVQHGGGLPGNTGQSSWFPWRQASEYKERIRSEDRNCGSVETYNQLGALSGPPCLLLANQIRPKDVMTTRTPFGELSRWLYYGKRQVLEAKQSPTSSIPRIAHITWLAPPNTSRKRKFQFFHFLSVLSALHVAGLRHVYLHGDVRPEGEWWERLKGENVTFVPIEAISQVFQQDVEEPAHRSDIIRAHLLRAYGGVYMDGDVMWVNRLPDSLLRYPTVACPDWPSRGGWPAAFNIGVLMSQSDSPWLRHFLATMWLYLDWSWFHNGIMMPYRVYERDPESLHIDHHLQVICYRGNCHPTWHDDYIRDLHDPRPPRDFDWREPRAYHFTTPKPPQSLSSPAEIRKRLDIFAEIGHLDPDQVRARSHGGGLAGGVDSKGVKPPLRLSVLLKITWRFLVKQRGSMESSTKCGHCVSGPVPNEK